MAARCVLRPVVVNPRLILREKVEQAALSVGEPLSPASPAMLTAPIDASCVGAASFHGQPQPHGPGDLEMGSRGKERDSLGLDAARQELEEALHELSAVTAAVEVCLRVFGGHRCLLLLLCTAVSG